MARRTRNPEVPATGPLLDAARARMRSLANPRRAEALHWFFRTGPGGYGEGDRFLGLTVPVTRGVAREFRSAPVGVSFDLLESEWHEERLLALFMMAEHFRRGDAATREEVARRYLAATHRINNWDLVDASAHLILGPWLERRSRATLRRLARSRSLWERRIAVVATLHFIRAGEFDDTVELCAMLLGDDEDLMHKACGWMLREVGKRDTAVLRDFLRQHAPRMPRTMLRYAIERFPEAERRGWLATPRDLTGTPRRRKT